jgi:HAD superfamily hydrolase (TIGR01509 family)
MSSASPWLLRGKFKNASSTVCLLASPFVFFDLGQTLIDEWEFVEKLDTLFLELLNGFGAKIDRRSYVTVRDSVIRDRLIGHGSVKELIIEVCKLVSPKGYPDVIAARLEPEIRKARMGTFKFASEARSMLELLADMQIEMGIIANQSEDITEILKKSELEQFFRVKVISSSVQMAKPDPRIFRMALERAARAAENCVMVGDRLDTDICPANSIGMQTIRYTNSLFSIQKPLRECENATFSVGRLSEIPAILERIILR